MTVAEMLQRKGYRYGVEQGVKDGIEKGMLQGQQEAALAIARKMVKMGCYSYHEIVALTGLEDGQVAALTLD